MSATNEEIQILQAMDAMFQDPQLREREYAADFRREWERVLKKALHTQTVYPPEDPRGVYVVDHQFAGFPLSLHFDQVKMQDWYEKELKRRSRTIFVSKRLKRSRDGTLTLKEAVCRYDPAAPEPALTEKMKNIVACALPGLPPELRVVYGNKWVDTKFNVFRQHSLSLFFLNTDYVPAFLASPREVALYLFLMDCCIVKENCGKVKDADLRQFLHIFRPSPMLAIKGLM